MFHLFGKKRRIDEKDYDFLTAIVKSLPAKYSYLIDQVSKEFILDKKINKLGDEGTYTLTLNAELENAYSNKSLPQLFIIRDIGIWNTHKNSFELVELHIMEGILAGFRVNYKYTELDFGRIDTTKIKEKHFKNEEKEILKKLLGKEVSKEVLSQLEIESTFKIEIAEGIFYVIKDLEDGNYIAIDEKGSIYGMIHDPYEIEKLFENKDAFFEALKSGEFNISVYYKNKML